MNKVFLERLDTAVGKEWAYDSLFRFLNEHVFAAGTDALFGDGFYSKELHRNYSILDRYFPLLAAGIPARAIPGAKAAQAYLSDMLSVKHDHQSELMRKRTALVSNIGLSPREANKVNSPLIWAAQANTIATAFWTVLLILRDPDARAQILAEINNILGEAGAGARVITNEMLRKMVKLDSAINETTRLMSMPLTIREATADLEFELASGAKLLLRKGEQLYPYPRITHLDSEIYPDPHVFKFDRFLPKDGPKHFFKNGQRVAFCLLPFGGGQSMCPGRFFARNEFKIVVATLLSAFEVELQSAVVPELMLSRVGLGVPPPQKDVPFRLRRQPH
jgi:cytochrome P450